MKVLNKIKESLKIELALTEAQAPFLDLCFEETFLNLKIIKLRVVVFG
jgi:hypothetical protein